MALEGWTKVGEDEGGVTNEGEDEKQDVSGKEKESPRVSVIL